MKAGGQVHGAGGAASWADLWERVQPRQLATSSLLAIALVVCFTTVAVWSSRSHDSTNFVRMIASRTAGNSRSCHYPDEPDRFGDQYLAICTSVKDQHHELREWANYHRSVGVGKIHLYDSGSEPPLNTTVQDLIDSGFMTYRYWINDFGNETVRRRPQMHIYMNCLKYHGKDHQFIAFIDADEFLVLKGPQFRTVPALLKHMMEFETFGALAVNWVVFGSSGHVVRPKSGVLQAYTACLPRSSGHSTHVKSIVNTDVGIKPMDPHHWSFQPGYYAVNERFQMVKGPRYPAAEITHIALHHYVTKSLEALFLLNNWQREYCIRSRRCVGLTSPPDVACILEAPSRSKFHARKWPRLERPEFKQKSERGSGMGNHKPLEFFISMDQQATENCTDAVQLGPFT